jgi:hypothetical protein
MVVEGEEIWQRERKMTGCDVWLFFFFFLRVVKKEKKKKVK